MLGNAPNESMDGPLVDLLLDLEQGIIELLDSLRCSLGALDKLKHDVLEVFNWIQGSQE